MVLASWYLVYKITSNIIIIIIIIMRTVYKFGLLLHCWWTALRTKMLTWNLRDIFFWFCLLFGNAVKCSVKKGKALEAGWGNGSSFCSCWWLVRADTVHSNKLGISGQVGGKLWFKFFKLFRISSHPALNFVGQEFQLLTAVLHWKSENVNVSK